MLGDGACLQVHGLVAGLPLAPELQPALVLLQEGTKTVGRVEKADPLLVIEGHRKAPEAVDADPALVADPELQVSALLSADLLLKLGDACQQFLFRRVGHGKAYRASGSPVSIATVQARCHLKNARHDYTFNFGRIIALPYWEGANDEVRK
jgi:hypothetical protein